MKSFDFKKFILSISICLFFGFLGSFFTSSSINDWYVSIKKPSFNPPNWIFGPVWTFLYVLMGISLYTIINRRFDKKVKSGIITFGIQLTLNFFWSIIFFGLKNILLAFIEIVVLWFFIIVTILKFWRIDKRASYLLIPYLTWVSFAAVLNFSIYLLNI